MSNSKRSRWSIPGIRPARRTNCRASPRAGWRGRGLKHAEAKAALTAVPRSRKEGGRLGLVRVIIKLRAPAEHGNRHGRDLAPLVARALFQWLSRCRVEPYLCQGVARPRWSLRSQRRFLVMLILRCDNALGEKACIPDRSSSRELSESSISLHILQGTNLRPLIKFQAQRASAVWGLSWEVWNGR